MEIVETVETMETKDMQLGKSNTQISFKTLLDADIINDILIERLTNDLFTRSQILTNAKSNLIKWIAENGDEQLVASLINDLNYGGNYKKWFDAFLYAGTLKAAHVLCFITLSKIMDEDYLIKLISADIVWSDDDLIKLIYYAFVISSINAVKLIMETWSHITNKMHDIYFMVSMHCITNPAILTYILDWHIFDEQELQQIISGYCDNLNLMKLMIDAGTLITDRHMLMAVCRVNIPVIELLMSYGIALTTDIYNNVGRLSVEFMQWLTYYDIYPSRDNFIKWVSRFFVYLNLEDMDIIAEFTKYIDFDSEIVTYMLEKVKSNIHDKSVFFRNSYQNTPLDTIEQKIIDTYGYLLQNY
jgi:hypothetical protein